MHQVEFPGQTRVIGKPANMTDEQCTPLPVRDNINHGFPCMESVWELTGEDLAMINKTKRVILMVVGTAHPPVNLSVWHE